MSLAKSFVTHFTASGRSFMYIINTVGPKIAPCCIPLVTSSQMGGRVVRWCGVNFQCRGVLLIWIKVGQGPTAQAVGAGGGLFGHFFFYFRSPFLWGTARYRLKYCLKGPLSPKQPTSQPTSDQAEAAPLTTTLCFLFLLGGGRVVRRCWVNFPCRGVLLIWIIVGQGPIALAVDAGGVVWTFFLSSIFSHFFLPLWETA